MFEFFDIFATVLEMAMKEISRVELLRAAAAPVKKFGESNIPIFERIGLNFSRMAHEFRISTLLIED